MKEKINSKYKDIIILLLWAFSGYLLSRVYIQFLAPIEVNLISKTLKYISSLNNPLNSVFVKDFILFFFSSILRILLAFLSCCVLTKFIGTKKVWVAGFIVSFIALNTYVNIDSLIYYLTEFDKIPIYGLKPSIISFIVDLIIIPISCIFGSILGNKAKKAYQLSPGDNQSRV